MSIPFTEAEEMKQDEVVNTDQTKEEKEAAFAGTVFEALLGSQLIQAAYIGYKLGWYKALRQAGETSGLSPTELAQQTSCSKRYALEWLEQQAMAGWIHCLDATNASAYDRRFVLPDAHAAVLADPDSMLYSIPLAQFQGGIGKILDSYVKAYQSDTGVGWAELGDDASEANAHFNRPFFLQGLGKVLEEKILDEETAAKLQTGGGRVADIGAGYCWSSIGVAKHFASCKVDAYDLDGRSIEKASNNIRNENLQDRVQAHCKDAGTVLQNSEIGETRNFYDLVMAFQCIHDLNDPITVLRTMRELAGESGTVVVMDQRVAKDFSTALAEKNPLEQAFYGFSCLCCLPDSKSRPDSVATGTVMRPRILRAYAQLAGFKDIEIMPVDHAGFYFYKLLI